MDKNGIWSRWHTGPFHRTVDISVGIQTTVRAVCGWHGPVKELVAGATERPGKPMNGSIVNVCARCAIRPDGPAKVE
jgi:hypothetical protein